MLFLRALSGSSSAFAKGHKSAGDHKEQRNPPGKNERTSGRCFGAFADLAALPGGGGGGTNYEMNGRDVELPQLKEEVGKGIKVSRAVN